MMIEIKPAKPDHDHRDVYINGKYVGFAPLESDDIRLTKCYSCNLENYAFSVMSGRCAWCGWDANKFIKEEEK